MIWLVLFSSLLVLGLIVMYGKLHDARNKGGRIDELSRMVKSRDSLIRKKNAYIKTLEKAVLDSASAERVAATLNSLFADEDSISAGAELSGDGGSEEAESGVESRIGFRGKDID
jgi:hypothetical protein